MFLTTVLVVTNAFVTLSGEDVAGIRGLILELCSSGIPSFELSAESAGLRPFSLEATSFWKFANSRTPGGILRHALVDRYIHHVQSANPSVFFTGVTVN